MESRQRKQVVGPVAVRPRPNVGRRRVDDSHDDASFEELVADVDECEGADQFDDLVDAGLAVIVRLGLPPADSSKMLVVDDSGVVELYGGDPHHDDPHTFQAVGLDGRSSYAAALAA